MTDVRQETDSLGVVDVPADKLLYPLQANVLETEI